MTRVIDFNQRTVDKKINSVQNPTSLTAILHATTIHTHQPSHLFWNMSATSKKIAKQENKKQTEVDEEILMSNEDTEDEGGGGVGGRWKRGR